MDLKKMPRFSGQVFFLFSKNFIKSTTAAIVTIKDEMYLPKAATA
jgi:hypothetical protein